MVAKRIITLLVLLVFAFSIAACASHTHVVGKGAQSGVEEQAKQWYILWGLVKLNDVDSQEMAGGQENYTIETKINGIDWLISAFLGIVSIQTRTVKVIK